MGTGDEVTVTMVLRPSFVYPSEVRDHKRVRRRESFRSRHPFVLSFRRDRTGVTTVDSLSESFFNKSDIYSILVTIKIYHWNSLLKIKEDLKDYKNNDVT